MTLEGNGFNSHLHRILFILFALRETIWATPSGFWSLGIIQLVICWSVSVFANGLFSHMGCQNDLRITKSPHPGDLVHGILREVSSEVAGGRPGLHSPRAWPNKGCIPGTVWFAVSIAKFFWWCSRTVLETAGNVGAFLRSQLSKASNLEFKVAESGRVTSP